MGSTVEAVVTRVSFSSSSREAWDGPTTIFLVIGGGGTKRGAWVGLGGVDLRSDLLGDGTGEETGGKWGVSFLEDCFLEEVFLELGVGSIILFHAVLAGSLLVAVELAF